MSKSFQSQRKRILFAPSIRSLYVQGVYTRKHVIVFHSGIGISCSTYFLLGLSFFFRVPGSKEKAVPLAQLEQCIGFHYDVMISLLKILWGHNDIYFSGSVWWMIEILELLSMTQDTLLHLLGFFMLSHITKNDWKILPLKQRANRLS